MTAEEIDAALKVAQQAAIAASAHAQSSHASERAVLEEAAHDIKLHLDVECQEIIESCIREAFPDHQILGEEDDSPHINLEETGTPVWIIDPIDGTVNFKHGHPFWACSIALFHNGQAVLGVVEAPAMQLSLSASLNQPARCNGSEISVSSTSTLDQAMIHTGMDANVRPGVPALAVLSTLATTCRKVRVVGSAALDLCYVALGRADGYIETNIYLWDVAAAGFIVERAGGKTNRIWFDPNTYKVHYLAGAPNLYEDLKDVVLQTLDLPTTQKSDTP